MRIANFAIFDRNIYSTLFVINDSSSKAIKHKHIYIIQIYTHQLKHTNTHATHYIYTRSPNINMISALPSREARVLYYSDKSPKNELRITFRRLTDEFILLNHSSCIDYILVSAVNDVKSFTVLDPTLLDKCR